MFVIKMFCPWPAEKNLCSTSAQHVQVQLMYAIDLNHYNGLQIQPSFTEHLPSMPSSCLYSLGVTIIAFNPIHNSAFYLIPDITL